MTKYHITCPICKSEQTELTMHQGYTYYYCENCKALINFDGSLEKKFGDVE